MYRHVDGGQFIEGRRDVHRLFSGLEDQAIALHLPQVMPGRIVARAVAGELLGTEEEGEATGKTAHDQGEGGQAQAPSGREAGDAKPTALKR